ncbi:uteroglobin, partial [Suricata suricatta]|uniref:uteroglobin n=1 Tax=Suricata suricatta TaxID=37032 RepID=UPI001155DCD3
SAASLSAVLCLELAERIKGTSPRPSPEGAGKAQTSRGELAAIRGGPAAPEGQLLGAPPDLTFNAPFGRKGCYLLLTGLATLIWGPARPAWKRAWTHGLSLFCASASAEVCQGFLNVTETLFVGTLSSYEAALEPFVPDADMKVAGTQLKKLVDTLPEKAKESILKLMVHSFL